MACYAYKAASSIAKQAFEGLEVVLVDDGSTDYSLECFMEYLVNVKVISIRQENTGPGGARNTGIKNASGEYIMFLDGDDFLLPNAFRNILTVLEDERPVVLFGLYHLWSDKKGLTYTKKASTPPSDCPKSITEHILGSQPEASWCPVRYICRREFVLEHNIFFETNMLCEDVKWSIDLLMTVENNCGDISFLPEPFYAYNHRRKGSTMNTYSVKRILDLNNVIVRLLKDYKYRPSLCRVLVWESFFYINEYCLFDRADRKQIIEGYRKVLPLYSLSGFLPHRIAGKFRNSPVFYVMSLVLFSVKIARRAWIHLCWVLKGKPHVEVPFYHDTDILITLAEQVSVEAETSVV